MVPDLGFGICICICIYLAGYGDVCLVQKLEQCHLVGYVDTSIDNSIETDRAAYQLGNTRGAFFKHPAHKVISS